MHAMNGMVLGSKQLVVRLHEPKQLRQEKLAQRFGHNGHPRSASGATSPTVSEAGDSFAGGWSSPRHGSSALNSPVGYSDRPDRGRRGSGSYYNVRAMWCTLPIESVLTYFTGCFKWYSEFANALRRSGGAVARGPKRGTHR